MRAIYRHIDAAYAATRHIQAGVDAVQLYDEAARAAEDRIPGDLGGAIAGVLAMAAESRRNARLSGNLGEQRTTIALALAVLGHVP